MQKYFPSLAAGIALLLPVLSAEAFEIVGKKLEIYGKVHLSIDSSDRDVVGVSNDGTSISNNSSRIGFKGELPRGNVKLIYKYEQGVNLDNGDGQLATRNSYGGVKGRFGQVIAGHHDTPFKTLGSRWGAFSDTVGDRRMILGASYSDGNQLNERAKNALMYSFKNDSLLFQTMHAIDGEDDSGNSDVVDNNDVTMTGLGLHYKAGALWCAVASETWEGHSKAGNVDALRAAVSYKFGSTRLGVLYETIDSDTNTQWKRDAYGVNAIITVGQGDIRAQYVVADSADSTKDTGGSNISLGYFHKLDSDSKVYLAYSSTDNDQNASFQGVDGGHGDEVKTEAGGSPSSVSVGLEFKF